MRPSHQSAGTVVVGGDNREYCGTCGGASEVSRQCSPGASEFGGEELRIEQPPPESPVDNHLRLEAEEKGERDRFRADKQLREELIERDSGPEGWMKLGRDTTRKVADLVAEQGEWENAEEADWESTSTARGLPLDKTILPGAQGGGGMAKEAEVTEILALTREAAEERTRSKLYLEAKIGRGIEEIQRGLEKCIRRQEESQRDTRNGIAEVSRSIKNVEEKLASIEKGWREGTTEIMKAITKTLIDHNVASEHMKILHREVTNLEATVGSTVLSGVARAVWGIRKDFKDILQHIGEGSPKEEFERGGESDSESDSEDDEPPLRQTQGKGKGDPGKGPGRRTGGGLGGVDTLESLGRDGTQEGELDSPGHADIEERLCWIFGARAGVEGREEGEEGESARQWRTKADQDGDEEGNGNGEEEGGGERRHTSQESHAATQPQST